MDKHNEPPSFVIDTIYRGRCGGQYDCIWSGEKWAILKDRSDGAEIPVTQSACTEYTIEETIYGAVAVYRLESGDLCFGSHVYNYSTTREPDGNSPALSISSNLNTGVNLCAL